MRIPSVFAIFSLAVGIAPSFALPSGYADLFIECSSPLSRLKFTLPCRAKNSGLDQQQHLDSLSKEIDNCDEKVDHLWEMVMQHGKDNPEKINSLLQQTQEGVGRIMQQLNQYPGRAVAERMLKLKEDQNKLQTIAGMVQERV
ncbi:hypothetical protein F5148DRAFT_1212185, partial [Russula earlei]